MSSLTPRPLLEEDYNKRAVTGGKALKEVRLCTYSGDWVGAMLYTEYLLARWGRDGVWSQSDRDRLAMSTHSVWKVYTQGLGLQHGRLQVSLWCYFWFSVGFAPFLPVPAYDCLIQTHLSKKRAGLPQKRSFVCPRALPSHSHPSISTNPHLHFSCPHLTKSFASSPLPVPRALQHQYPEPPCRR